jgi:hypothetical protein
VRHERTTDGLTPPGVPVALAELVPVCVRVKLPEAVPYR